MKSEKSEVCGEIFPYDGKIKCQLYKGHSMQHEYHDTIKNGVIEEGMKGVEITFA